MLTFLEGLYPGLTETDIAIALDNALRAAGLEPFFDIVLFGLIHLAKFASELDADQR
jgi:Xaa-Pro aminopeptidase